MTRPEFGDLCPLLQVFDMPTSIAFYRDVLGFQMVESSSPGDNCDWCWLRLGDSHLMLNTRYEADDRPPAPDPARVAMHDDIGFFFGCADVDAMYAYLRSRGVDVDEPATQSYGMRQVYARDPDGYVVCFQKPAGES